MTDLTPLVSQLSGKHPSHRIENLLESWILPNEPIVGALHGNIRWQPAWLVLTESVVIQVRDGRSTTVEAVALIDEVTGYQEVPGWTGSTFHIGTTGGQISIEQADPQYAISFIHAVERTLGALSPSGVPTIIHPVVSAIEALEASLKKLLQDRSLAARVDERSPMECAIAEFVVPYAGRISQPSSEGYGYVLLLWLLSLLRGDSHPRWIAAQNLWHWARNATASPPPLLGIHDSLDGQRRDDWKDVLGACGEALESAAYLLASQQARAALLDVAAEYRSRLGSFEVQREPNRLTHPSNADDHSRVAEPDLVSRLERLAKLHDSGAIDDEEFVTLKRAIIQGL